jgi:DNA phosphorothioation-associated putative methyltransferase
MTRTGIVVGKRIGGALYLHASAVGDDIRPRVARALEAAGPTNWNVVKLTPDAVSLLLYEDFDQAAFPALLAATRVSAIGTVTSTDYAKRDNPPILHRKETLLRADDPRRPLFVALTQCAERHGLFADPIRIGTRRQWSEILAAKRLRVQAQSLVSEDEDAVEVARHKTAITRRELSVPMQLAVAHGVLSSGLTVLDYGCGLGDDVAALTLAGYAATGWDPHHAPDAPLREADLVNLGFVLNVIEDPEERRQTLQRAWRFARQAIVVSVMTFGKADLSNLKPYRDGYLTARGTFQKYYGQQELRDFIEASLGDSPRALGAGVFAVFRDKELEQEVLFRRRSGPPLRPSGMRPPVRERVANRTVRPSLVERLRPELEELWAHMLLRGRALDVEEIPEGLRRRLQSARVATQRANELCLSELFEQEQLVEAARTRREDLLVRFAMLMFPGAPKYTTLPRALQRDVRALFGSHAIMLDEAKRLMFSAGKRELLASDISAAVASDIGAMRDDDTFRFALPNLDRLPPLLRLRILCAGLLRGGVEGADFVEVKLSSPRVKFIACADPDARVPRVTELTRIDLGRTRVTVDKPEALGLFLKAQFLAGDDSRRSAQRAFDAALQASGLLVARAKGPRLNELSLMFRADGSLIKANRVE